MKISILSTFYPFRGGIAQFSASLYRALEQDHDVDAITFKRQYPNILFPGKTQYVSKNDNSDPVPAKRLLDSINPITWRSTAQKIKKTTPDILLFNFWMPFFGPSMGYIASHQLNHTKKIAVIHNAIPHEARLIDKPFLRYFLNRIDGFVVMSEQVKRELLALKPNAKFIYKQHPLYAHFGDPVEQKQAREKLQLDPNKKTLLYFGIIRNYKGLDLLIDAMGKLDDSYQLIIAGESYGSFELYEKKIRENPNRDRIYKHVRYIADDEVPYFFSAADACVLPYRSATQSGITSIAYHFNLPLIATDVGGLKEMVIDNETGKIISSPTIEDIKDGVQAFFEKDSSVFSEQIQKKKSELSWEGFGNAVLNLYDEL